MLKGLLKVVALIAVCGCALVVCTGIAVHKEQAENEAVAQKARYAAAAAARREADARMLDDDADAAQARRGVELGGNAFPAYPKNAIHDCALRKMQPLEVGFGFNTDVALAYKLHFSDDALAQRFVKYVRAAADCTAYSHSDLARALIPALDSVATPQALGTIIAAAADTAARAGDQSIEGFSMRVNALLSIGRRGKR